ncbi:hypothetical protein evm_011692 [Chilo suppressalis]|nr:hypothetical protein evm_011692 [Chilo suppressalis]
MNYPSTSCDHNNTTNILKKKQVITGVTSLNADWCFKVRSGVLPNPILVYRDGVGDGQIPFVRDYEVAEIKKALNELYQGQEYKFAFIIVSKRINTRIFVETNRGGANPRPGTVIDDVVTLPERSALVHYYRAGIVRFILE